MKTSGWVVCVAVWLGVAGPATAGGVSEKLLLASAWCSFSYNKVTGYSNSTRVQFSPTGSYSTGGRGEGGSSGPYGSYASQRDSGGAGLWKVVNGELFMSEGQAPLEHVETRVTRNSSGYPVIVADGAEYTQCR